MRWRVIFRTPRLDKGSVLSLEGNGHSAKSMAQRGKVHSAEGIGQSADWGNRNSHC